MAADDGAVGMARRRFSGGRGVILGLVAGFGRGFGAGRAAFTGRAGAALALPTGGLLLALAAEGFAEIFDFAAVFVLFAMISLKIRIGQNLFFAMV